MKESGKFNKGKSAEKLVHDLATKTFLTDWCYLNPALPNGKELCDLLVIFDDVALIWQIKDLKLNEEGRYSNKDKNKNLRQLAGAYRELFTIKTPIKLQNPRRMFVPLQPDEIKEVYLISALLGDGEETFSFIENIKSHNVHVFTKSFLRIILRELDTISDFVEYMRAKQALIYSNKELIIVGGEEELLAFYLAHNRSFDSLSSVTSVVIDKGSWKKLSQSSKYRNKKKEDILSYGWDDIINRVHECSAEYEIVARELARPNRFHRRILGKVYYEAMVKADNDKVHNIFRRTYVDDGTTYCFLFSDNERPRTYRIDMLKWMCYVARGKYPSNNKIIGIATEKYVNSSCSYDFVLLNIPIWDVKNQKEMERAQKALGILVNPLISEIHEDEYPI